MPTARHSLPAIVMVALFVSACVSHLPPPARPAIVPPQLRQPPGPLAAGHGRVVLDVVDGPTEVELVTGYDRERVRVSSTTSRYFSSRSAASGQTSEGWRGPGLYSVRSTTTETRVSVRARHVCTSPCVVDLPLGSHELRLTLQSADSERVEHVTMRFDAQPRLHRRVLELREERVTPWALGVASLLLGAIGLLAGALGTYSLAGGGDLADDEVPRVVGVTALSWALGVGLTSLGVWLVWPGVARVRPGVASEAAWAQP